MTYRQKQNYILVGLVICAMLVGVYFERLQADSFFQWGEKSIAAATLYDGVVIDEEALCTGKILTGNLNIKLVKAEMDKGIDMVSRLAWCLTAVIVFSQLSVLFHGTVACGLQESNESHWVIIRFIHKQDGEKD